MATLEIARPAEQVSSARLRQVVVASVLGTAVEWYDFLIYGVAAALGIQ